MNSVKRWNLVKKNFTNQFNNSQFYKKVNEDSDKINSERYKTEFTPDNIVDV